MDRTFRVARRPQLHPDRVLATLAGLIGISILYALLFASPPAKAAFPGVNGPIACGVIRGNDVDLEIVQVLSLIHI